MSEFGRRSKGCYRCRAKKIKCDEKIPACGKCVLSRVQCPGYRPENELIFHDMNQKAERKALGISKKGRARGFPHQRKRSHDSNQSQEGDETISSLPKNAIKADHSYTVTCTILKPIATDWIASAQCLLFQDYVLQTSDAAENPGFLAGLPELCLENPNGIISNAVKAVALANLGNQAHADALIVQSRRFYGKALLQIRHALTEGFKVSSDDFMGGILMVNMYDMFAGDVLMRWSTHADALAHLLLSRGTSSQFTNETGSGLNRGAHRVITFKNLLQRKKPGFESELFDISVEGQNTPSAIIGLACNRIARILPVADSALEEDTSTLGACQRLLDAIRHTQNEDHNFEMWRHSQFVSNSHKSASGISALQDLEVAGYWNPYRAARLMLLETFVRLLAKIRKYPELSSWVSHMDRLCIKADNDIHVTVIEIIDTVSGVLGDLDIGDRISRLSLHGSAIAGYTSVYPLRVALMMKNLNDEQKTQIHKQLEYIYKALGFKQARKIKRSSEATVN